MVKTLDLQNSNRRETAARILLPVGGLLAITPWISSGVALVLGAALALLFGNPYSAKIKGVTHRLLAIAVMGLGAGMNLEIIGRVGAHGIGYTIVGILTAVAVGTVLGRLLKNDRDTSLLITMGTAICGGSAIAAIAPVIRAKDSQVSVALATVFLLNGIALLIFPWVGHQLRLSESQFGLWSALAIHDTSSVVGATIQYGPHAVEVGTTVKLARALWIIPAAMVIGFLRSREEQPTQSSKRPKRPWFILGFIIAAALVTWVPALQPLGHNIESVAKRLLVLTLFLIGSGMTMTTIRTVGAKPFAQGILLWIVMGLGTLAFIYGGHLQ